MKRFKKIGTFVAGEKFLLDKNIVSKSWNKVDQLKYFIVLY